MKLGKIAGVSFRFNLFFLFLCILYSYLGLLCEILMIIAALLIHEMAHALVAAGLEIKISEVELFPFGGQAKVQDFTGLEPEKEIYLALAGPLISLSVAAFLYFLDINPGSSNLQFFIKMNFYLAVFNFLPALPLDGGRAFRALISPFIGYKKASRLAAVSGKIIAMAISAYGCYLSYIDFSGANYILIGAFLYWAARREEKNLIYAFMRFLLKKKGELKQKGFLSSRQIVCQFHTPLKAILDSSSPHYYILAVVLDEGHNVIGIYTEAQLIECLLEKGPGATFKDV